MVPLLGNHEEMLLAALEGPSELRFWLKFGGMAALTSYGHDNGQELQPAGVRSLIPTGHLEFIKGCRDYYETTGHIFLHANYKPERQLHEQSKEEMRWGSLPCAPQPHCSGKVVIVGHTAQRNGEILDLGFLKCIDTCCHGGGWLTALDVGSGKVWQVSMAGQMRQV